VCGASKAGITQGYFTC